MTQQNPRQHRTNSAPNTLGGSPMGWTRSCLRFLVSIPVAIAKGVIVLSGAIGNAAGMAYVDPFMSNGRDRK